MSLAGNGYRFAFDIGGTFTDLVLLRNDGAALHTGKVLSNAHAMVEPIFEGLRRLCVQYGIEVNDIYEVVVGATTVVTNLVIERKGARTALITTAGFRDVLEIGRELRYDLYNLLAPGPDPVIPRRLRLELLERVDASGEVLCAPNASALRAIGRQLQSEGVESVAVCLLHSYTNPANELFVGKLIRTEFPSLCLTLSHQVLGELREYERSVAAVLNAYVMPKTGHHLSRIEEGLRKIGVRADLRLMQSNGGVISRAFGERFPIRLLESGPAAGALGAAHTARMLKLKQVLAFDMGGTTAKACLVSDGHPGITHDFETARMQRFKRGSGLPVRLPTVDLIEIGAGGGSIARVDATGLIKVGPESAGSEPGPACYGLGGEHPTVTDAALLLGYLDPQANLSGAVQLRHDLAEGAMRVHLADRLGMSVIEAANGVHRIVCEQMATAAKVHAVEKARDVRHSVLLAFGGAGPLHAREVGRRLRVREVLVPSSAGVFSAFGLLVAPLKVDQVRTRYARLDGLVVEEAETLLREMEAQLRAELLAAQPAVTQLYPESVALSDTAAPAPRNSTIRFVRSADMRYVGQGFEVGTPLPATFDRAPEDRCLPGGSLPASSLTGETTLEGPPARSADQARAAVMKAFEEVYARHFGAPLSGAPAEILNWRVEAYASPPSESPDTPAASLRQTVPLHAGFTGVARSRRAFFPCVNQWIETLVIHEDALEPELNLAGPALVEQAGSTVVVGPGDTFWRDALGNIHIRLAESTQ
jgi:N-methylhydantoinase A/oxoprolinase/acetone carboxylase beta subunit